MLWSAHHLSHKLSKEMDVFAFLQDTQNFLKARCARSEPQHGLPPAAEQDICAALLPPVHGKAAGDCALRCAGLFYLLRMRQQCCKLTSCAARAAKGQQERERARKQRKQKHRKKQQIVAGWKMRMARRKMRMDKARALAQTRSSAAPPAAHLWRKTPRRVPELLQVLPAAQARRP